MNPRGTHLRVIRSRSLKGESGMTLIELLVAGTISAILVVIMFRFFTVQTYSYIESKQTSEMQQELRWGMDFVSKRVKLVANGVPPTCGWPVISNSNGAGGASDSLSILGSFKSLVITTTQTMGNEGSQIKVDDASELEPGDLAVISDGTHQEIFYITEINPAESHLYHDTYLPWNDDKKLEHRYVANSSITVVSHYSFFVGIDDEGRSNLMVKTQSYDPQILIGDVDDFQVRFKMSDNLWIDDPYEDEIYDIRMIEITIRTKSSEPLKNYIDPVYDDPYKRIELKSVVIPQNLIII